MKACGGGFDQPGLTRRLDAIEAAISQPDAWNSPEKLTPLLREKSGLENELAAMASLKTSYDNMHEWCLLAEEAEEAGEAAESEEARASLTQCIQSLDAQLERMEMSLLLGAE